MRWTGPRPARSCSASGPSCTVCWPMCVRQAVITAKGQGHTYRAIGERMGVTGETAGQIAAVKNRASSE